jgi:4-cresol dehydrogenase (hydroxylating)
MNTTIKNVTLYPDEQHEEIQITSLDQLTSIILESNQNKQAIYPVSTGFNWGMGSKVPTSKNCLILNLSGLNQILEVDKENATITIEPGVTQFQVMNYLEQNAPEFFIDVTGSSKDTSIIGNTLERGISYITQRNELLYGLEIMTGEGKILKTGSWRLPNSKLKSSYKHGVGPNLTECFIQSNFGIVTKAIIKLQRVKKYNTSVLIAFGDQDALTSNIECFNSLISNRTIDSIYHIANRPRMLEALIPEIEKKMGEINCVFNEEEAKDLILSNIKEEWNASGFLSSDSKKELRFKKKMLKKRFKNAKVSFISLEFLRKIKKNIKGYKKIKLLKFIYSVYSFKTFYIGNATDAAMGSVVPREMFLDPKFNALSVDTSEKGFAFCLPLMPMQKKDAEKVISLIKEIGSKSNFDPAITLNPIKENLLEAVVSISYTVDTFEVSREFIRTLQIELNDLGYYSYRTNVKDMDLYFKDPDYNNYLSGIKSVFDPNGIISPGRYEA